MEANDYKSVAGDLLMEMEEIRKLYQNRNDEDDITVRGETLIAGPIFTILCC